MTADRQTNSNLNHPNSDADDATGVNTVNNAAGIPADNTNTPTAGANGQQQQRIPTRISEIFNDNAGRPR